MAQRVIVGATIEVNTAQANTNVTALNANLNTTRQSLNDVGTTAGSTGAAVEGTGGSFGKLKASIGSLPGPLGAAGKGVEGLQGAFKALLANPIGLILAAIVGVLTLLYKAFANTFEGGQKIEQVFAGIGAVGQSLLDNLGKIGSAIKNIFTFNFSAAIKDIKEVGNAAADSFKKVADLTKQRQQLDRAQAQNDFDQIERQARIADLKEKLADSEVDPKEKLKAGKELLIASQENAKEDLKLAKDRADNAIAQLLVQKEGAEKNKIEILKIQGEQKQGEIDNSRELLSIRKLINRSQKEIDAEAAESQKAKKAAQDKANLDYKKQLQDQLDLRKQFAEASLKLKYEQDANEIKAQDAMLKEQTRLDKLEADRIANNEKTRLENKKKLAELNVENKPDDPTAKIALINSNLDLELIALADGDVKKQILAEKAKNEIVKLRTEEKDAKIALAKVEQEAEEAKIAAVSAGFGNLAQLAGKQTAIGKAFAIAQTTIDTYQSAIAAYKSLAGIPVVGPALGAIAAAAAIATGIATVKKIVAVPVPGGGGGASAPSISAPAAPLAPTQQGTRLDQNSINGLGSAVSANPIQAFIQEGSIRDNAERSIRLNRAARIGG